MGFEGFTLGHSTMCPLLTDLADKWYVQFNKCLNAGHFDIVTFFTEVEDLKTFSITCIYVLIEFICGLMSLHH